MPSQTFRPAVGANSPVDGWVGRIFVNETFSTIRNGSGNAHHVSDYLSSGDTGVSLIGSTTSNRFATMLRTIMCFNTSSLPDDAIIIGATLRLSGISKSNSLGSTDLHIVSSAPNSTSNLSNSDYEDLGGISFGSVTFSNFNSSGFFDIELNDSGIQHISNTSVTKFGLVLGWDLDASFSGSWGSGDKTEYRIRSADWSGTSSDPQLVIEYIQPSEISGTINFSGFANAIFPAREISGTINFSGSVTGIIEVANEATERKSYLFKVYDLNDEFIGIWDDVISPFGYSQEINSAGSSTYVRLARNSDSLTTTTEPLLDSDSLTIDDSDDRAFQTIVESRNQIGPGSNVNHNYRVDVFVFYGEISPILDSNGSPILDSDDNPILGQSGAPNGRRVFNGFISEIESQYGDEETTLVELTSFGFDLDQYVIEDTGETTVPFNSYDPSDIVSEAMNDFNTLEGIMDVSSTSVETTGTTVSYTFRVNTYLEVLQKSVELAPADWFWYADLGTNLIHFRERPSTPRHLFYLGEHIESLSLRSYIGDVVNDVYFSGGEIDDTPVTNLFKRYTDTPATNTRRGLRRLNDNRVILESAAEILSEGEIERNNRIQYRSEITILSKVYDIEDIHLGDLIGFRNFDNYVDSLTMQVVSLTYSPEKVTLALDTLLPRVSKRLEDIKRQLNLQEIENNPDAPT